MTDDKFVGKDKRLVVSPEGADELLMEMHGFRITQTSNGKFRIYLMLTEGNWLPSPTLHETYDGSKTALASMMAVQSMLYEDPEFVKNLIDKVMKNAKK